MLTLLLVACSGTAQKPSPDTAESRDASGVDSETGGDSADLDTAESDASTESGESADTGDSQDTAPPTDWSPGDAAPGWEDADCTEASPGRAFEITFPSLFRIEGTFLRGQATGGPHLVTVKLRDCANFTCALHTLDTNDPYVSVSLDATGGSTDEPRGTGTWGPDEDTDRHVRGDGKSVMMDWSNGDVEPIEAAVSVCLERVRPDGLRGVVRVEVTQRNYPWDRISFYDSIVLRFPFDVLVPDHAGFDARYLDVPADLPDGYPSAHFVYELPYGDAWPWDDITDPSIREQLYERYTPYNAP